MWLHLCPLAGSRQCRGCGPPRKQTSRTILGVPRLRVSPSSGLRPHVSRHVRCSMKTHTAPPRRRKKQNRSCSALTSQAPLHDRRRAFAVALAARDLCVMCSTLLPRRRDPRDDQTGLQEKSIFATSTPCLATVPVANLPIFDFSRRHRSP